MLKRIGFAAFVLLVVIAIGGFYFFRQVSGTGSSAVEQWIGQQLQLIANSYLNPHLAFDDLDYQYPGTVTLKNLRLTAEDPDGHEKTLDILGCASATITLGEIPSVGKPIVIEKFVLDQPLISAVAVKSGGKEFVGFSHLVKSSGSTTKAKTNAPKLSDHFKMRMVQIIGGKILYDPRIDGTEPMVLDQINTSLDIQPAEAGWYKFSTNIKRDPVFDLGMAGQLNLDSFSARDLAIKLTASLSPDKLSYLPPQIQKQLKKYEITGDLKAQLISTDLKLIDPLKGKVDLTAKLDSANCTFGEYRIPIQSLDLQANTSDGALTVPELKIAALSGNAQISGTSRLEGNFDGDLQAKVSGLMLQELLATKTEGQPPKLAGKLDASLQAQAPFKTVLARMASIPATMPADPLPPQWGSGSINLTEARLVRIPIVQGLSDAFSSALNLVRQGNASGAPGEKAMVQFTLKADKFDVTDMTYIGEGVGMRGKGTVGLDRTLDLLVNGGPVERVQQMLGQQVGGTIGLITDKLLAYRVTGTLSSPKTTPEVAGGAIGNVGRGVQSGAEGVGNTIGRIGEGIGNIIKPKDGDK